MSDELLHTVRALPKIDLHRHLEGSVRLETLLEIARDFQLDIPSDTVDALRPYVQVTEQDPHTWSLFLSKFTVLRQFFRTPDIIRRITREVIADAAADNVRYLELRFTPHALNNLLHVPYADVITWVCEETALAAQAYNIDVSLIVSTNRQESVAAAQAVIAAAVAFYDAGVRGIDLAGQEATHPVAPFAPLFAFAKSRGLGITVHAGEWDGAHSVRDALTLMLADRIGHGVRVLEDAALVELLQRRQIVLEVCPTSNVQSGVVETIQAHPLPLLVEQGIAATLNTDDPLVSNITLSDEIVRVLTHTSLTLDDIKRLMLTAAQAAFLPEAQREHLVTRFQDWLYPSTTAIP